MLKKDSRNIAKILTIAIFSCASSCNVGEEYYYNTPNNNSRNYDYTIPNYTTPQQPIYYVPTNYPPQNPRYHINPYETPVYVPVYDYDYHYQAPVRYRNIETPEIRNRINKKLPIDFK
jgi:hypothetical protein